MSITTPLSPWQRAFAQLYADGDFAWVIDRQAAGTEIMGIGDGLFTFCMIELDPAQGCDSWQVADRRLDTIIEDLTDARGAIKLAARAEESNETVRR